MTNKKIYALALPMMLSLAACSSLGMGSKSDSAKDLAANGPTVVSTRSNPDTIELNRNWQPTQQPQITAEVKDFTSKVSDVKLRFLRAPLEIPMQNIGGTTWQATLSPEQVRTLAVGGTTMKYEANVIARNQDGLVAVSANPVQVAVKAPDLTKKNQDKSQG